MNHIKNLETAIAILSTTAAHLTDIKLIDKLYKSEQLAVNVQESLKKNQPSS